MSYGDDFVPDGTPKPQEDETLKFSRLETISFVGCAGAITLLASLATLPFMGYKAIDAASRAATGGNKGIGEAVVDVSGVELWRKKPADKKAQDAEIPEAPLPSVRVVSAEPAVAEDKTRKSR